MNSFPPVISIKMSVFNHTVHVISPHLTIYSKANNPYPKQQPSALNMINLKETFYDEAFEGTQNFVCPFIDAMAGAASVISGQVTVSSSPDGHCCFFLSPYPTLPIGEKTLMETLADRFVYLFETSGIQPRVSHMLGRHSYRAVSTAPQLSCF